MQTISKVNVYVADNIVGHLSRKPQWAIININSEIKLKIRAQKAIDRSGEIDKLTNHLNET